MENLKPEKPQSMISVNVQEKNNSYRVLNFDNLSVKQILKQSKKVLPWLEKEDIGLVMLINSQDDKKNHFLWLEKNSKIDPQASPKVRYEIRKKIAKRKVQHPDNSVKTMLLNTTVPVADLLSQIAEPLSVIEPNNLILRCNGNNVFHTKSLDDNGINSESILELRVKSLAPLLNENDFFYKKFDLHFIYSQYKENVILSHMLLTKKDLMKAAALDLRIVYGEFDIKKHDYEFFSFELLSYILPPRNLRPYMNTSKENKSTQINYDSLKDIKRMIIQEFKKINLDVDKCKMQYINVCQKSKWHDMTFFSCLIIDLNMQVNDFSHILVGVSNESIVILGEDNLEELLREDIRRLSNITHHDQLISLNFGNLVPEITLISNEHNKLTNLISAYMTPSMVQNNFENIGFPNETISPISGWFDLPLQSSGKSNTVVGFRSSLIQLIQSIGQLSKYTCAGTKELFQNAVKLAENLNQEILLISNLSNYSSSNNNLYHRIQLIDIYRQLYACISTFERSILDRNSTQIINFFQVILSLLTNAAIAILQSFRMNDELFTNFLRSITFGITKAVLPLFKAFASYQSKFTDSWNIQFILQKIMYLRQHAIIMLSTLSNSFFNHSTNIYVYSSIKQLKFDFTSWSSSLNSFLHQISPLCLEQHNNSLNVEKEIENIFAIKDRVCSFIEFFEGKCCFVMDRESLAIVKYRLDEIKNSISRSSYKINANSFNFEKIPKELADAGISFKKKLKEEIRVIHLHSNIIESICDQFSYIQEIFKNKTSMTHFYLFQTYCEFRQSLSKVAASKNENKQYDYTSLLDDCVFLGRRFLYSVYIALNSLAECEEFKKDKYKDLELSTSIDNSLIEKDVKLFHMSENTKFWPGITSDIFDVLSMRIYKMKEIAELPEKAKDQSIYETAFSLSEKLLIEQKFLFYDLPKQLIHSVLQDYTLSFLSVTSNFVLKCTITRLHLASISGKMVWLKYQKRMERLIAIILKTLSLPQKLNSKIAIISTNIIILRSHLDGFIQVIKKSALLDEERENLVTLIHDIETRLLSSDQILPLFWSVSNSKWLNNLTNSINKLRVILKNSSTDSLVSVDENDKSGEDAKLLSKSKYSIYSLMSATLKLCQYCSSSCYIFKKVLYIDIKMLVRDLVESTCKLSLKIRNDLINKVDSLIKRLLIIIDDIKVNLSIKSKLSSFYIMVADAFQLYEDIIVFDSALSYASKSSSFTGNSVKRCSIRLSKSKKYIDGLLSLVSTGLTSGDYRNNLETNDVDTNYIFDYIRNLRAIKSISKTESIPSEDKCHKMLWYTMKLANSTLDVAKIMSTSSDLLINFSRSDLTKRTEKILMLTQSTNSLINSLFSLSESDSISVCKKAFYDVISMIPISTFKYMCIATLDIKNNYSKMQIINDSHVTFSQNMDIGQIIVKISSATTKFVYNVERDIYNLPYLTTIISECLIYLHNKLSSNDCQDFVKMQSPFSTILSSIQLVSTFSNYKDIIDNLSQISSDLDSSLNYFKKHYVSICDSVVFKNLERETFDAINQYTNVKFFSLKKLELITNTMNLLNKNVLEMQSMFFESQKTAMNQFIKQLLEEYNQLFENVIKNVLQNDSGSQMMYNIQSAQLPLWSLINNIHINYMKNNLGQIDAFTFLLKIVNSSSNQIRASLKYAETFSSIECEYKFDDSIKLQRSKVLEAMMILSPTLIGSGDVNHITLCHSIISSDSNIRALLSLSSNILALVKYISMSGRKMELINVVNIALELYENASSYIQTIGYEKTLSTNVCNNLAISWKKLEAYLINNNNHEHMVLFISELLNDFNIHLAKLDSNSSIELSLTIDEVMRLANKLIQSSSFVCLGIHKLCNQRIEKSLIEMNEVMFQLTTYIQGSRIFTSVVKKNINDEVTPLANLVFRKYKELLNMLVIAVKDQYQADNIGPSLLKHLGFFGDIMLKLIRLIKSNSEKDEMKDILDEMLEISLDILYIERSINSPEYASNQPFEHTDNPDNVLLEKVSNLVEMIVLCKPGLKQANMVIHARKVSKLLRTCLNLFKKCALSYKIIPIEFIQLSIEYFSLIVKITIQWMERKEYDLNELSENSKKLNVLLKTKFRCVSELRSCIRNSILEVESELVLNEADFQETRLDLDINYKAIMAQIFDLTVCFIQSWNGFSLVNESLHSNINTVNKIVSKRICSVKDLIFRLKDIKLMIVNIIADKNSKSNNYKNKHGYESSILECAQIHLSELKTSTINIFNAIFNGNLQKNSVTQLQIGISRCLEFIQIYLPSYFYYDLESYSRSLYLKSSVSKDSVHYNYKKIVEESCQKYMKTISLNATNVLNVFDNLQLDNATESNQIVIPIKLRIEGLSSLVERFLFCICHLLNDLIANSASSDKSTHNDKYINEDNDKIEFCSDIISISGSIVTKVTFIISQVEVIYERQLSSREFLNSFRRDFLSSMTVFFKKIKILDHFSKHYKELEQVYDELSNTVAMIINLENELIHYYSLLNTDFIEDIHHSNPSTISQADMPKERSAKEAIEKPLVKEEITSVEFSGTQGVF